MPPTQQPSTALLHNGCVHILNLFNARHYSEAEHQARILADQFPDVGFIWKVLGAALKAQGKNALPALQKAVELLPDDPEAHSNLGFAQNDLEHFDEAIASCRRALALDPAFPVAHNNLGNVFKALGRTEEAAASYRQALTLLPNFAEAHFNLGKVLRELGQLDEAVKSFHTTLVYQPANVEAHINLGYALKEAGRLDEAVISLRQALMLRPDFFDIHCNLGVVLHELGHQDSAVASYRQALTLKPDNPEIHYNLGNTLKALRQFEDAAACYRKALAFKPDFVDAYCNLGVTLKELGQFDDALACYHKALSINPDDTHAHYNMGIVLLLKGEFEQGWRYYHARFSPSIASTPNAPHLPFARWQGESLVGKSLLICREQGLGDEIHFCRYIPLLKGLGVRRISLVCSNALQELLATVDGVDALHVTELSESSGLSSHIPETYDYWTLMLDIPLYLSTRLDTIPADVPYLSAHPRRVESVAAQLAEQLGSFEGIKIGLCWKGNPKYGADAQRTLGLVVLQPLFTVTNTRFFSLHHNTRAEFLAAAGSPGVDLGHELDSIGPPFQETAALITQLDLIISCDTATAHLAGALGKPVWLLLPFVSDWRWMIQREDTPWYPNTVLFRQRQPGDWVEVIQRVYQRLESMRSMASMHERIPGSPAIPGDIDSSNNMGTHTENLMPLQGNL